MLKKIIHCHPNGRMAAHFVEPLIQAELSQGYQSMMVNSCYVAVGRDKLIRYDLALSNLFGLPWHFLKLFFFLRQQRPDLLVSHNAKSSLLPLIAACISCVPKRIYFNHGVPYVGYRGILRLIFWLFEWLNCRLATEAVTVSPDMARILGQVRSQTKISVINRGSASGIDLDIYRRLNYRDSNFRQSHGIKEKDFVVVFVGRPERRKGFDAVMTLWDKFFTGEDDFRLVLCGPSHEAMTKNGQTLPANILCLGFCDNVPEVLCSADCLILPSLHEGLSYAVLEAMACGCLVLVNDIDGIRNLVEDQVNGFLVPGNSLEIYSRLLHAFRDNPEQYASVRVRGVETAAQFSRETFMPAYLSFIQRVLEGKVG